MSNPFQDHAGAEEVHPTGGERGQVLLRLQCYGFKRLAFGFGIPISPLQRFCIL
jgi:hypothetical protein